MKLTKALVILLSLIMTVSCVYLKMNPPPDVDKTYPPGCLDNTCWMATASNMLAGAGYGTGTTVQTRANEIYGEMINQFGTCNGGWIDTALDWWLSSANNTWPGNPYDQAIMRGHTTLTPFTEADLPENIGRFLRDCNMVGISVSWVNAAGLGERGHAMTAWGDNIPKDFLDGNPSQIFLCDSDSDPARGTYTVCNYDNYSNPNPGGNNLGNGWYIDYTPNHPFIKHYTVLSPTASLDNTFPLQVVIGSYKIYQGNVNISADDLHYQAATDVTILSYRTELNWLIDVSPAITEADPRRSITVDWDLSSKPVPYDKWITITTEFVLPRWNAMQYKDVYFTYKKKFLPFKIPGILWKIDTPFIDNPTKIKNVRGGYVLGEFEIINSENGSSVGIYRFTHQYSYNQTPEYHRFFLAGDKGYLITNIKFGHHYGYLETDELWGIKEWMTEVRDEKYYLDPEKPIEIAIDWQGRLPYPDPGEMPEKNSDILMKQ